VASWDHAVIEVYRKKGTRDMLRSYQVIIDGREVGRLRRRQTGRYEVEPGHHDITIGIDWNGSQTVAWSIVSLKFAMGKLPSYPQEGLRTDESIAFGAHQVRT
jgi:hypothetical protein